MSADLISWCCHPSSEGAEGPIADLGRMAILWTCCVCGALHFDGSGGAS